MKLLLLSDKWIRLKERMEDKIILVGDTGKIYERQLRDLLLGIVSKVSRNRHIILIDYDDADIEDIKKDAKKLQKEFDLGTFYILETSEHRYATICFVKVPFKIYEIVLLRANCCQNFVYYTLRSKLGTLRITKKYNKPSILRLISCVPRFSRTDYKLESLFWSLLTYEENYRMQKR